MRLTRREMLGAGMACALPFPAAAEPEPGLAVLAAAKRMRFGSCFAWSEAGADAGSFANPAYAVLLERDCGLLVPENEFKWQALRPDAATYDFSRFDAMIGWAEAREMPVRGHTLLWHKPEYYPKWLMAQDFGARPASEAARILGGHIRSVCARYTGRIASFDVVNEAVDEKSGALRTTPLSDAFGGTEAMLDFAFRTAREAAPTAQLVYNDYMSWEPGNEAHRAGVLALLEGFRRRHVPVNALGVQSHIGIEGDGTVAERVARQEGPWRDFLDRVVAMGYKLIVTELDVSDAQVVGDDATRDGIVADYAGAYLDVMFAYPELRDVLVWGMSDRYSWLKSFRPRADGSLPRATPYDAAFRAKPLHRAIAEAFSRAEPRD